MDSSHPREDKGKLPLAGIRFFVVPGGGISPWRATLLCEIGRGLGAEACETFAELHRGDGGEGGLIIASPLLAENKLKGIIGDESVHTIVSDSWISSCADSKTLVPVSVHARTGAEKSRGDAAGSLGGDGQSMKSHRKSGKAHDNNRGSELQEAVNQYLAPPAKRRKIAEAEYVLVLAVKEPEPGSDFFRFKECLRTACSDDVHEDCAQRAGVLSYHERHGWGGLWFVFTDSCSLAGTLHFTLHKQKMTEDQAANVTFESPPQLPLTLKLIGCLYTRALTHEQPYLFIAPQ